MKYLLYVLFGFLLMSGVVGQSKAEVLEPANTVGIDFASMPVGTTAHYADNRNRTWQVVYRGKEGKYHVMESIFKGAVSRTLYYHDDGTLHQRVYAKGNVRTFSPRRCFRVLGACSFVVSNTRPKSKATLKAELKKKGSTYHYSHRSTDGSSVNRQTYELGQYNLFSLGKTGKYSSRLTKITYSSPSVQ